MRDLLAIAAREADEIERRFPKVQRRVGGYNLDALVPGRNDINLAHLLVGSEGTLAFSTRIELKLSPLLGRRAVGACHFGSFHEAMEAAQHIVKLGPIAVELIDRTMLGLARDIAMFQPTVDAFVRGDPEAILFVEFAEEDWDENLRRLQRLGELIGDLGFAWDKGGAKWGGVVEVLDPKLQAAITEVRTAGLNIMMSMKEEGKPISFVEDCAVPLEHLADYTARLTRGLRKQRHARHLVRARLGRLPARAPGAQPAARQGRARHARHRRGGLRDGARIQGLAFRRARRRHRALGIPRADVRRATGARLRGGEGPLRSARPVQSRQDRAGAEIRRPRLFRYGPDYRAEEIASALDWSAYPGAGGGFQGAVEMCNNNGACRALAGGVMCPSYRVTRDERDVTRGRANTLRLAITGQLGPDALASDEMAETLKLCVSCKACRRECPTGVDMARMKIEVLARARAKSAACRCTTGWSAICRATRRIAARLPWLLNLRDAIPRRGEIVAKRSAASARSAACRSGARIGSTTSESAAALAADQAREVVLFADTFNRYFERENIDAALARARRRRLSRHVRDAADGARPLCCGRTFLSVGKVDEARRRPERTLAALAPFVARGMPVVGLEPSCLFGFRDEIPALVKSEAARAGRRAARCCSRNFWRARRRRGRLDLPLAPAQKRALLHGHCHQKSFDAMAAVEAALKLIPELDGRDHRVELLRHGRRASAIDADTIDVSRAMGELSLLPAVRKAPDDAIIVADGTSCRHQIKDGTGREALHVARVLAMSLG